MPYTSLMRYWWLIIVVLMSWQVQAAALFETQKFGGNSAVLVVGSDGKAHYDWQADKLLVPASTLKLVTGLLALEKWGADHRFATNFYIKDGWLWVKGSGDPFLISEELAVIAERLAVKLRNDTALVGIGVDGQLFGDVTVPGRASANDPYNAPLSAVAANFNTVFVSRKKGKLYSAEPQTPLTATARRLAASLGDGEHRVHLRDSKTAQQYFAELLAEQLRAQGVAVGNKVEQNATPAAAQLVYQHQNSHSLAQMVQAMMTYSNNFIANQLFLLVDGRNSVHQMVQTSQYVKTELLQRYAGSPYNWANARLNEGAGLSRDNRLTAQLLYQILVDFEPHDTLLRSYMQGRVRAKTGTLSGVRTFAGYMTTPDERYYFVFLFNESVPYRYRDTLLQDLWRYASNRPR